MKGRFQPTTVGNMARDQNGGYVCAEDYDAIVAKHAALEAAYQKQGETAAAMISRRDAIIAGLRSRIANAIHWAEHAMLMYSYQNKELLGILRDEAETPNALGQDPCAAVCARSPAPTGCASRDNNGEPT